MGSNAQTVAGTRQHLDVIARLGEIALWEEVPALVAGRYKEAIAVKDRVAKIIKHLPAMPGYGYVFWHPEEKTLWAVLGDSDDEQTHQKWHNALKAIPGVLEVRTESEYGPHGKPDWIRIKKADAYSLASLPYNVAGAATGGPSPLSNAIVSMLLGGGLGYGVGTIGEQFLPEHTFEPGVLRRRLAMLGAGIGAMPSIAQAGMNQRISQTAGKPLGLSSLITPNEKIPMSPDEGTWEQSLFDQVPGGTHFQKASAAILKEAYAAGGMGSRGVALTPVPVDAFNRAIWNDVSRGVESARYNPYGTRSPYEDNSRPFHTPPAVGAAVSGLVTGVQQQFGGQDLLTPRHFISGLAAAGIDAVTARAAGGLLGVLGGLKPEAQQKLQTMGLWSGMIRGVAQSVLGL